MDTTLSRPNVMAPYKRSRTLLIGIVLVYALLVATHLGEFWPFSIYPMFSQGGKPWSRVVVRDVSTLEGAISWETFTYATLPGEPFAVLPHGINTIDLADFVSKTTVWDADRLASLHRMFEKQLDGRRLLVMRANGHLDTNDMVTVEFIPYILLDNQGTALNPSLTP